MNVEHADLHTESFSNSRGWTIVRVTHTPSSVSVERSRTPELQSAVEAQKECIEEIERILAQDLPREPAESAAEQSQEVTRAEFEALLMRVAALERRMRADE
jgi:hypothetical protein